MDTTILECGACKRTFQNPRLLPCAHSFCLGCVEQCALGRTAFPCPTCNANVKLPPDGCAAFPENVFAVTMIRMTEQMRALTAQVSRGEAVTDRAASVDRLSECVTPGTSLSGATSPSGHGSNAVSPTTKAADGPMCSSHPHKVCFTQLSMFLQLSSDCDTYMCQPLEFFCKGPECRVAVCSMCLVGAHQGPGHACVLIDSAAVEIKVPGLLRYQE